MDYTSLANKSSLGVLYFGIYSFSGWVLEVGFRSIMQHHFVNPGFLHGPFLPIYGVICLLVLSAKKPLAHLSMLWHFALFIASTTLLEYFTGWYFWHQFGIQLWNYNDIPINYNGLVALPFSLAWGALCLVFEQLIHPFVKAELASIPLHLRLGCASLLGMYLIGDIFYSLILITTLDSAISPFHEVFGHTQNMAHDLS